MEELVRFIAKNLVDEPDSVVVESREEGDTVVISLSVAPADMGKVIGRQGRIAKAIRTVVKAASVREEKKYMVDIVEQGEAAE
ncbi:MAG: KH domain-containing protein [Clostridiales bacterium]|nr:KH domain-containing protein [Clostridiales bacterium]